MSTKAITNEVKRGHRERERARIGLGWQWAIWASAGKCPGHKWARCSQLSKSSKILLIKAIYRRGTRNREKEVMELFIDLGIAEDFSLLDCLFDRVSAVQETESSELLDGVSQVDTFLFDVAGEKGAQLGQVVVR